MLGRLTALVSMAICILLMSEGAGAAGPELPTLQPGVLRIGTYFVNPPFDLIVNTVRTPKIRSLSDLRDAVVGVQAVTTDDDVALRMQKAGQIRGVKVYPFDRVAQAMSDLAAGRISAVMKVHPVAVWLARQKPELHIVAQVPDDPQPLGIGFNKQTPALVAAVDRALADMKQDGAYERLARKWSVP
jgi:ABC-type amino acid transport substrate-binding protein